MRHSNEELSKSANEGPMGGERNSTLLRFRRHDTSAGVS
jgi:hypothetical protein